MKTKIIIGIIVVIIVMSGIWYGVSERSTEKETIKIGAILPLDGVNADYGQFPREGIELALEEINSEGGINESKLEIIYENSQSQTSVAVTGIQKLINVEGVPVILTGAASSETLAEAPVAEQNKVVLLAAGSAAPAIRFAGDYIFRLKLSVDKEIEELMEFTHNKLQAESIYILYVQNDYGEGVNKFSNDIFTTLGGKVLGREGYKIEEADMRTYLIKAKNVNPDVIVLAGHPRNMGRILKQAEELGINKIFIAPGGTIGPEIIEIAGKAADGLIYTMEFNKDSDRKETKTFRENFKKKYGKEPELFASMGYDAVKIIATTLEICGVNSECIKNELYNVKNYQGATAEISFDDYGDVLKPMALMTIRNGQLYVPYEE